MPPRNGKSSGAGGSAPQPLPASPRAAARRQSTKGGREVDGSDYEEEAEEEEEGEEEEAGVYAKRENGDGMASTPPRTGSLKAWKPLKRGPDVETDVACEPTGSRSARGVFLLCITISLCRKPVS
jgi:hypothetical protein